MLLQPGHHLGELFCCARAQSDDVFFQRCSGKHRKFTVQVNPVHRGVICQFLFWWIYYCHGSKSTGKKTGKTHLCATLEKDILNQARAQQKGLPKQCPGFSGVI